MEDVSGALLKNEDVLSEAFLRPCLGEFKIHFLINDEMT